MALLMTPDWSAPAVALVASSGCPIAEAARSLENAGGTMRKWVTADREPPIAFGFVDDHPAEHRATDLSPAPERIAIGLPRWVQQVIDPMGDGCHVSAHAILPAGDGHPTSRDLPPLPDERNTTGGRSRLVPPGFVPRGAHASEPPQMTQLRSHLCGPTVRS